MGDERRTPDSRMEDKSSGVTAQVVVRQHYKRKRKRFASVVLGDLVLLPLVVVPLFSIVAMVALPVGTSTWLVALVVLVLLGAIGAIASFSDQDMKDGLNRSTSADRSASVERRTNRTLRAVHESGDRFTIETGRHRIAVDTSAAHGGADSAATPVEVFVASLVGCMAITAERYLRRHGIRPEALELEATFTMSEGDRRVNAIHVRIQPPEGFLPHRRRGMLAAVRRCAVHNSIVETPLIDVELEANAVAA